MLLGLILTSVTSCRTIPKYTYEDKGLNFKVTEDFRIVKTKTWKRIPWTYIKIDRRNEDLYANLSVSWMPKNFNLDKELQHFVESLKEAYAKEAYPDDVQKTPVFSEVRSTKFGSHDAREIDYVVANDGPRIWSYISFHCDSITVIVGQHYTRESQAMTNRCRQIIEETCNCVGQENKKQ